MDLSSFLGVHSEVILSQTRSVHLKPSETLRLTCSYSGFSLDIGVEIAWIRQTPGKGLQWISSIQWDDDKFYLDTLRSRLTVSTDSSKNKVYLQMTGMETRDTGTYYCAAGYTVCKSSEWVGLKPAVWWGGISWWRTPFPFELSDAILGYGYRY